MSAASLTVETVAAHRAALWRAGFRPVPILNWDANVPSPGKQPLAKDWRADALKDPPYCLTVRPVTHAMNSGILGDGLRAIDADLDNPDIARRVRTMAVERFGEAPIRERANSSRFLMLYRAADGQPRKVSVTGKSHTKEFGCKVEALGAGQQFVAFGRHDSGADLKWFPEAPGEIALADLPAITEADLFEFLTEVAELIDAEPPNRPNGKDHHAAAEAQASPLRIAAAVARIQNTGPADWEEWNRVGMALWAATGGSVFGGELFNEWSRQHPSYNLDETLERWRHYQRSPPTHIGAGTLFHMAGGTFWPEPELPEPPPEIDDPGYHMAVESDGMSAADWSELEARESGQAIPASPEARQRAGEDIVWAIAEPWIEADIPVRPWIARGYLMRRAVTVLSGPGSAGKSSLMVAWACAMAIGSPFHRMKIAAPLNVATYNVEDDADEQKRRFSATLKKMGLTTEAVRDNLLILGPSRVGTLLQTFRDGTLLVNTPVLDKIEAYINEFRPDVLMLDPFVELHQAEENDNTAIRGVMARFRAMAIEHNMAVVILHHSRKGGLATPGDPDSLRGASSIVGAARVALTLNVMTEDEARTFGLPIEKRNNFFRMDRAKSNYAPIEQAEWFERHEVQLDNGTEDNEPDGVAVVWPWRPANALSQQNPGSLNRVLDVLQQGPEPGILYTSTRQGGGQRWAGKVLMSILDVNDKQAVVMIAEWMTAGLLTEVTYQHPTWRRATSGVQVDDKKRPKE